MKTRVTNKLLSAFLAIVMVVTMLPAFVITASADSSEKFLMAYFTGNDLTHQQIRFAVSDDGFNFKPLYGGNAVLYEKSTDTHSYTDPGGTTYTKTNGVRDPFLFDGQDGYYYCVATDLDDMAYGWWGNQPQMVVWRSADLINWSDAYYINMAQIINATTGATLNNNQVYRAWAPEVYVEDGEFLIHFGLAADGYNSTTLYYMTTDNLMDWTHYSAPQQLYRPADDTSHPTRTGDAIDADIVKQNGVYYMIYKDENASTACLATATNLKGPYHYVGKFATSSDTGAIEGNQIYTVGNNYYFVADRFSAAGNFAIYNLGSDLSAITATNNEISVSDSNPISTVNAVSGYNNLTPRHGSFLHISDDEYNALCADSGGVTATDVKYNFTLNKKTTASGWAYDSTIVDSSLNNFDIMYKESGSTAEMDHDSGTIVLRQACMFMNDTRASNVTGMFPDDVYTVSFDYSLEWDGVLGAPIFTLGTGSGAPSANTDYVMMFGNGDMWVRKSGESSDTWVANAPLQLGVTYHYDIVSDGTNITFYRDGVQVGKIAATVDFPTSGVRYAAFNFSDGHNTYGYGIYSNIRFRDSAVTADTLKADFAKDKVVYRKDTGSDAYGGRGSVINVSKASSKNTAETFTSRLAPSYTIAGWINPGATVNENAVITVGSNDWQPKYGRYFAVTETGHIHFNFCSNTGDGDAGSHFFDLTSSDIFGGLETDAWSYVQINITQGYNNLIRISAWVNGTNTYSDTRSITGNGTGEASYIYDYGPLGLFQLSINKMMLGYLDSPNWWQVGSDTTYVQDFRVYAQAMDPNLLYVAEMGEQEIVSNYSKLSDVPTFDADAYHVEDVADDGFSNVVWQASGSTYWQGSQNPSNVGDNYLGVSGYKLKIASPKNIVLAYDGVNDVKLPVVLEEYDGSGNSKRFYYLFPQSDIFELRYKWRGNLGDYTWNVFPNANTAEQVDYQYRDSASAYTSNNAKLALLWNALYYSGGGNTSTYYDLGQNITYKSGSKDQGNSPNESTVYTYTSYYVINYKQMKDIVNGTTKVNINGNNYTAAQLYTYFISNIEPNKWQYTEESIDQFYRVMYAIVHSDPTDYSYGGSSSDNDATANDVKTCAKNIKIAVEEFPQIKFVKKEFNIDYFKVGGAYSETVTAGDTLGLPASLTDTHYNGGDTLEHTTYSWQDDNAPSDAHVPTSDEQYKEIYTVGACNSSGSTHVDAVGDTNGYTEHPCTVCHHNDATNNVWDDRTADWSAYNAVVDTIATKSADTQYTTSSRTAYSDDCAAVTSAIDTGADKSKAYIDRQKAALTTAEGKLNHVADFSTLDSTMEAKAATKTAANSNGTGNVYTYNSWIAFAEAYTTANTYYSKTAVQRADTPKYATDGSGYVTSSLSTDQTNINTYSDDVNATFTALVEVDNNDKYESYETAKTVVSASLDTRKFNEDAIDLINGAITTGDAAVYKTLNSSEAARYNACTGTSLAEGAQLRNAVGGATDTQTGNILTASSTINDANRKEDYINKYKVSFTIQYVDDDSTSYDSEGRSDSDPGYNADSDVFFGDSITLTVPDSLQTGNKLSKWSSTNYDDAGNALGSQVASGSAGFSYEKVVGGKVVVVAELSERNKEVPGSNRYDICDGYGHLVDVIYSTETKSGDINTATISFVGGGTAKAKSIPMYTFNHWELVTVKANYYKLIPHYEGAPTYNFTFVGASSVNGNTESTSSLNSVDYDTLVTIDTNVDDFAAWAVRKNGKYQIASYNKEATFFACANEEYVALVSDGKGGYQTTDPVAVPITANLIDGDLTDLSTTDADVMNSFIYDKIENKKPFIAIQNVKMTTTQARVYARITQGATGSYSYGVLIRQGNYPDKADMTPSDSISSSVLLKRYVSSALSTGQFSYTLNSKSSFTATHITFRAFTDYTATYEWNSNSYDINGTDYSTIEVASRV